MGKKVFGTLHTLPRPPPSVDGGKKGGAGSDGKSLPAASNGMSNIKNRLMHSNKAVSKLCKLIITFTVQDTRSLM